MSIDIVAGLRATSTLVSTMLAASAAAPMASDAQPRNGAASSAADSPSAAVTIRLSASRRR